MNERGLGGECGVVDLDNGLRVYFHDQSRPIVGNRSLVQLLVRVPITVLETHFSESENPSKEFGAFTSHVGQEIEFRLTKTRNFIDTKKAPALLEGMKEEFLQANRAYLSKPSFPKMFVIKQYQEWKTSSSWQEAYRKHKEDLDKKEGESEQKRASDSPASQFRLL